MLSREITSPSSAQAAALVEAMKMLTHRAASAEKGRQ